MKALILSHGHPELSPGGGERAAYSLFEHLKRESDTSPVFIARADGRDIGHDGWFGAFRGRKDEFLWTPPQIDWFRCVSQRPDILQQQLKTIAESFEPDLIHFHHYYFFGLDAFPMLKATAKCPIVLTLHEYGLICNHNGQMVKRGSLRLCNTASPAECGKCFPEISSGKFFLREVLIKQLIADVDAFVSPSQFLRSRYTDWGLGTDRIEVIENLLPPAFTQQRGEAIASAARRPRLRFGYFGQVNQYKGANVLLDALAHLSEDVLDQLEIVIFGAKLEDQPEDFRASFVEKLSQSSAKVSFYGPYRNEDVGHLLQSVDWMVIPSIWWENSPVVIQEAKAFGVPILASNIGGMAEKVRDGVDGLHFLAGSAMDCASKIEAIIGDLVEIRPSPLDVAAQNAHALQQHRRLYDRLAAKAASGQPRARIHAVGGGSNS